ncbi:hypothetical protein DPMN_099993 [Dreissena polymorpha]|uniref:Uncharacterized protein n=1 Tax=Dreissena polymorpha TaxID=45954 RepID=A0A9D4R6Y4_DREPO|nr:hypothetical protein DPMN_099993 [Dreissena polymorpha]
MQPGHKELHCIAMSFEVPQLAPTEEMTSHHCLVQYPRRELNHRTLPRCVHRRLNTARTSKELPTARSPSSDASTLRKSLPRCVSDSLRFYETFWSLGQRSR